MSQLHDLYRLSQHVAAQRVRLKAEEAKAAKWQRDTNFGLLLMLAIICIPVVLVTLIMVAFR